MLIRKGIPVSGGMAGGSADAAATLVGLANLWKLEIGRDELSTWPPTLGSDVPFMLHGGTALGTGRGEAIVPVLSRHTFHWVLAFARGGLATPKVYGELDRLRAEGEPPRVGVVEPVLEALASGDPRQLALLLGNDLQAAAVSLRPGLRRTLRAGVAAGALAGHRLRFRARPARSCARTPMTRCGWPRSCPARACAGPSAWCTARCPARAWSAATTSRARAAAGARLTASPTLATGEFHVRVHRR